MKKQNSAPADSGLGKDIRDSEQETNEDSPTTDVDNPKIEEPFDPEPPMAAEESMPDEPPDDFFDRVEEIPQDQREVTESVEVKGEAEHPNSHVDGVRRKRKLRIVQTNPQYRLYSIKYEGGGEVPDDLKGTYTSVQQAQKAIEMRQ